MHSLFEVRDVDRRFYEERLRGFLPDRMIDIHTHVWKEFCERSEDAEAKAQSWPARVADVSPIEDLLTTYDLMFPDMRVTPLIFGTIYGDIDKRNAYVADCSRRANVPSLIFSSAAWEAEDYERRIIEGGFVGAKSYLTEADPAIPVKDITIFDYFPHHQLEVLDRHGWIMMLHIPRDARLKDPRNLEEMLEIERRYPNLQVIIAHVGRAYCNEDVGNAFEALSETRNMKFDFSANTNDWVFEQLIEAAGPKRILFGSDMPVLRMRMKRICENGVYINVVPKGMYGDVSGDAHMRECDGAEADNLTFFMYEEMDAFRKAAERTGLGPTDIEDVFYNNAAAVLSRAGWSSAEPGAQ